MFVREVTKQQQTSVVISDWITRKREHFEFFVVSIPRAENENLGYTKNYCRSTFRSCNKETNLTTTELAFLAFWALICRNLQRNHICGKIWPPLKPGSTLAVKTDLTISPASKIELHTDT